MGPALWLPSVTNVVTKARKLRKSATKLGLAFCGYYTFTSQVSLATPELETFFPFHIQVADIFLISGPSMVPTLAEGDIVLAVPIR